MRIVVHAAAACLLTTSALAAPIIGTARIVDGDTLRIGGVRVRLQGIDAPEMRDRGGLAAKRGMIGIVGRTVLRCEPDGSMTWGRVVAICRRTTDGLDVGGELIRQGFALDCGHFSRGRYRSLEPAGVRTRLTPAPYCGPP